WLISNVSSWLTTITPQLILRVGREWWRSEFEPETITNAWSWSGSPGFERETLGFHHSVSVSLFSQVDMTPLRIL
ncbi:hypothetical protein BgiMline_021489, partial [Biomphalaria glabrata]